MPSTADHAGADVSRRRRGGADDARPTSRPTSTSTVDAAAPGEAISPLILGVSSTLTADELRDAGLHAQQLGRQPVDPVQLHDRPRLEPRRRLRVPQHELRRRPATRRASFVDVERRRRRRDPPRRADARVGRRNDDHEHVLVPRRATAAAWPRRTVGNCEDPQAMADPEHGQRREHAGDGRRRGSAGLVADGLDIRFIAMDNEPELWGVHPLRRPPRVPDVRGDPRQVPRLRDGDPRGRPGRRADRSGDVLLVRLLAHRPGPADGSDQDFLEWFLRACPASTTRRRAAHARRRRRALLPAERRLQRQDRPGDERPAAAQHPVAVGPGVRRRVVDRPSRSRSSPG